jgi:flagellin
LDRAASLASQSASGTFAGDRQTLQDEVAKVMAEITRQSSNIGLNTTDMVGAPAEGRYATNIEVYVGGGATAAAAGNVVAVDLSGADVSAGGLGLGTIDLTSAANAKIAVQNIKDAVGSLGEVQGQVGAGQNNLSQAIDLATAQITNFQAAESSIRDADIAAEASNMARLSTLQQAGVSALAQANQSSQALLSLLRN